MFKLLVVVTLLAIVASLASALVFMMRNRDAALDARGRERMARALTVRIGLSIMLFLVLLAAYALGWIQPHGLIPPHP